MRAVKDPDHPQRVAPVLVLLMAAIFCTTAWARADHRLQWSPDHTLLSLQAEQADTRQVLREVSHQIGFELWISERVETEPLDLEFASLPLPRALERILAAHSFVLVTDDDDQVTSLSVLPAGEARPARIRLETGSEQEQLLQRILRSDSIPNRMKSAVLLQSLSRDPSRQEVTSEQRTQALTALIDHIEAVGSARPETLQRLRAGLAEWSERTDRQSAAHHQQTDRAGGTP